MISKKRKISGFVKRANSRLQTVCVANSLAFFGKVPGSQLPQKDGRFHSRLKKQPNCCRVNSITACKATESPQPSQPDSSNVLDPDVLGAADDVASSWATGRCCCTKLQSPNLRGYFNRNPTNQLVVYPIIYRGFIHHPKRRLGMGFLHHQQ